MTPVEYHEAAEEELLNEIGYLELRATGLGRRLFGDVLWAENLISQFPKLAAEILPGTIDKDRVLILAVAHHSRRPAYWIGRVSQTEK